MSSSSLDWLLSVIPSFHNAVLTAEFMQCCMRYHDEDSVFFNLNVCFVGREVTLVLCGRIRELLNVCSDDSLGATREGNGGGLINVLSAEESYDKP